MTEQLEPTLPAPVKTSKKRAPPHPNSQDPVTGGFVKEIWLKKPSKKLGRDLWHLDWIYYRHRYKLPVKEYYKNHFGRTVRIVFRGQSQPTEMTIAKEHYADPREPRPDQVDDKIEIVVNNDLAGQPKDE